MLRRAFRPGKAGARSSRGGWRLDLQEAYACKVRARTSSTRARVRMLVRGRHAHGHANTRQSRCKP
eukprot:3321135-Lingulodinium_polyedra.AAC.1